MTTVVGIDPGISGALAFLRGGELLAVEDMPTLPLAGGEFVTRRVDGGKVYDVIIRYCGDDDIALVVESVRVLPGGGEKGSSAQSESSLVRALGAIEAVGDILGASPILVPPQRWQKHFGLVGKSKELRERGEMPQAMQIARRLYPRAEPLLMLVKHWGRAESVLIAHYGLTLIRA